MNHLRKPHLCALGYGCMVTVEGGELGCCEHEAEMAPTEVAEMAAAWKGDDDALEAAARPIIARLLGATWASMGRARAVVAMNVAAKYREIALELANGRDVPVSRIRGVDDFAKAMGMTKLGEAIDRKPADTTRRRGKRSP